MPRPVRTAVAALVAAAVTVVAGCGGAPTDPNAPTDLDFLSYSYGTPDAGGQAMQELIDRFERVHPEIRVHPEGVAAADVLTRLKADAVAGDEPDVAQIGWSKMTEAARTLPLTPVQQVAGAEWAQATATMAPNLMRAVADDGVVTAMPFTMSIPIVYYNADLFRAAGLDPDHPPTTLAEFARAALAIRAHGAQGGYVAAVDSGKSDFMTQSVVNSAGGALVGPDGQITVDSPPVVAARGGAKPKGTEHIF